MLLLVNVFISLLIIEVKSVTIQYEETCRNHNGRRLYVELGKKGVISGGSDNNENNNNVIPLNQQKAEKSESNDQCKLELITCPACVINIKFLYLNIIQNCNKYPVSNECNCDHLLIYEPSYEEISSNQFCGLYSSNTTSQLSYKSKSHMVDLSYFGKNKLEQTFLLEYSAERNVEVTQGHPNQINGTQIISTPYFPHFYPADLIKEYIIRCNSKNCNISLVFTDFLLAKVSVMEVFDWNGKRLEVSTGMIFRPSPIVSSGPFITIRFYANGATNRGFKALYSFLSESDQNDLILSSSINCGGLVDNLGGGITMMHLVKDSTEFFDCVWILQPSRSFLHFYTHLYLEVIAFSDFVGSAELWIHRGITSSGHKLEVLINPSSEASKHEKHVLLISEGFYVRFKGILRDESKLALAYTAFSSNGCIIGTDFLCQNQRCIPIYLQCDGFDHCGDNSDEPVSCFQDEKHRRWYHTSNFFFPKTSHYSELHVAAIVFLICCFGLVSLIVALIVLIFRISGRVHQQRQIENHLQVITDLLDEDAGSVQEEIIEDDPPEYEPPPNYEELTNGSFQKRGNRRDDNNKKTSLTGNACSRCSKRLNFNLKTNSTDQTLPSTSGTSSVPDSPPPNYNDATSSSQVVPESSSSEVKSTGKPSKYRINIKNISESKQNFFARHFSNDDFSILKRKVLQKSKRRKNRHKAASLQVNETNLNYCLSDSELSEINLIGESVEENELLKLQRSFSFDDCL